MRHGYFTTQWQLIEERTGSSTTAERQFVWGTRYIDDLVLRDKGSERLYATHDQWHVTGVVDTSGVAQERYIYSAFGVSTVLTGMFGSRASSSFGWDTRYGAYRFDAETALYCVRYRYLHPALGRWMSRDPIGEFGGLNTYTFARSAPSNVQDAHGLAPADKCKPNDDKDDPIFKATVDDVNAGYPLTKNMPPVKDHDNCYSYALNWQVGAPGVIHSRPGNLPWPGGEPESDTRDKSTCDELRRRVKIDGGVPTNDDGCCPKGTHKIHLRIGCRQTNKKKNHWICDFHFARQNQDGSWSHYVGTNKWELLQTDAVGNKLTDPIKADWDFRKKGGKYNYDKNCGIMCAPNNRP